MPQFALGQPGSRQPCRRSGPRDRDAADGTCALRSHVRRVLVPVLIDTLDSIRTHPLAAEIIATNVQGGIKSPQTGLRVLGAPLGHLDWCKLWLRDFVAELQPLFDAVAELAAHDHKGAAQAAFLILKYSAGTKFNYLLRMVTPSAIEAAAVAHDEAVLQCLSLLLDAHALPLGPAH